MKKILMIIAAITLLFTAGCDSIFGGGLDYKTFSTLIADPTSLTNSDDGSDFTFKAMIYDEFIMESSTDDDINGDRYAYAYIARESANYFLINLSDVDFQFTSGDLVEIEGEIDGYLSSTDNDGAKINVLNVDVDKIKPATYETSALGETDTYKGFDGISKTTFKSADFATDVFGRETVIVYVDFESLSYSTTPYVALDGLDFYQGDNYLTPLSTNFNSEDVKAGSENGHGLFIDKGQSAFAYLAFESSDKTTPITVYGYDDDFNIVIQYVIPFE